MSVEAKLTRLSNARDDIIDSLINKGVTATGHGFEDFADDIDSIVSLDISDTTATEEFVYVGKIFYKADGTRTLGTMPDGDLLSYGSTTTNRVGAGIVGTMEI